MTICWFFSKLYLAKTHTEFTPQRPSSGAMGNWLRINFIHKLNFNKNLFWQSLTEIFMQLNAHCSPHTAHKTRQDLFYTMLKILTWINTLRYTILFPWSSILKLGQIGSCSIVNYNVLCGAVLYCSNRIVRCMQCKLVVAVL